MTFTNYEDNSRPPWWVGSIYKIGIPAAIAIYLIWFLSSQVRDSLTVIEANSRTTNALIEKHVNDTQTTIRLLQQICINSGTTNDERVKCLH